MRAVVLGCEGMLGHKMLDILQKHFSDTAGESRSTGLVVGDFDSYQNVLIRHRPHFVINCIGAVKQRDSTLSGFIAVNSRFPRDLAYMCQQWGARLIHFSTDCVFSGKRGNYLESDCPDPEDVYGVSKYLGEVQGEGCLTIRTSIVGRERANYYGLLEWFLRQRGEIKGFTKATWTGVTTNWLAEAVATLLLEHPDLEGLYQIASPAVSKHRLLHIFKEVYGKHDVQIVPVDSPVCDRSLNGTRFEKATGIKTPDLLDQVADMRVQDRKVSYAL